MSPTGSDFRRRLFAGYGGFCSLFTVPLDDEAADAVLIAFRTAREAGLASVDCYRAGVDAWRKRHPDQTPEYAAKRAVAIILAHNVQLGVRD
jgi:hypothetical protein